jgi:hypothetical protein
VITKWEPHYRPVNGVKKADCAFIDTGWQGRKDLNRQQQESQMGGSE